MVPLIDRYSRRIRYVRLSVTDRCNFRCRYCMPETGVEWMPHESIMRYEEALRVIDSLTKRGVEKLRLTGGEPLVRKGIVSFVRAIDDQGGITDLSLTTNGVLLSAMAPDLRRAGLNRVNISLDSLKADKFAHITRVDALDKVLDGIESALREGLNPVKINVVAIRGFNDDEIPAFARLSLERPLEIRFIELMPMGCAQRFGSYQVIRAHEIKAIIEAHFGELSPVEYGDGPAKVYRIDGAKGRIGLIDPLSEQHFCERCNRVRITANGLLRPCLFSDASIDLLGPLRRGISRSQLEMLLEEGVMAKLQNHGMCRGLHSDDQGCATLMSEIGG